MEPAHRSGSDPGRHTTRREGARSGEPSGSQAGPVWERWSPVLASATSWEPDEGGIVVVVPHPDDEVLLFGGLLASRASDGRPAQILAASDGDAAYDPDGDPELARRRVGEQGRAVEALGRGLRLTRLGLPDGRLSDHSARLQVAVTDAVRASAAERCTIVAPWVHDVHPDHEACGRAALAVAAETGAGLMYGLFWTWHRRDVADLRSHDVVALDLDADAVRRRGVAIAEHRSQLAHDSVEPVLTDELIEPVRWNREYYIVGATPR